MNRMVVERATQPEILEALWVELAARDPAWSATLRDDRPGEPASDRRRSFDNLARRAADGLCTAQGGHHLADSKGTHHRSSII